jgi:hypothetical protein
VKFNGNHPGASLQQIAAQRTFTGTNVEHKFARDNLGVVDQTFGPPIS